MNRQLERIEENALAIKQLMDGEAYTGKLTLTIGVTTLERDVDAIQAMAVLNEDTVQAFVELKAGGHND